MQKTSVVLVLLVAVVTVTAVGVILTDSGEAEPRTSVSTFSSAEEFRTHLASAQTDDGVNLRQPVRDTGRDPNVERIQQLTRELRTVTERIEETERGIGEGELNRSEAEDELATLEQRRSQIRDALEEQREQVNETVDAGERASASVATDAEGGGGGAVSVSRESDTNVQVAGIDEPDILKTGGGRLFYSGGGETKVIDALPPSDMSVSANLSGAGEMLHEDGRLVSLREDEIVGYGVDGTPERDWTASLNSSVFEARLHNGTVYAVLSDGVDRDEPCPIRPMSAPNRDVVVPCEDIHRPDEPTNVDTTYTVVALDASDGDVVDRTSFVGSAAESVVYVSRDAVYVTYTRSDSEADVLLDFALSDGRDIFNDATLERFERLDGYELSDRAKRVELESIIEDWRGSLDGDERIEARNELENRMREYVDRNLRDFETTQIVRVNTDTFGIDATGSVPGVPLNQFALDEHDGELRVATTVGESVSLSSVGSENDVYVLNENLERTVSAQGMGEGQRVYSVRFTGDTGYVVTYRQIDPFYVLDLSDPSNPTIEGELKLPGYSSYLHPLGNDRVLGIGEENGRVKAVVFGVSDPTDPTVHDDYILDEYSSAAVENHRAFLHDERHGVFFLPGSRGGYVFSYDDGLELEKAVNVTDAKRAAYINDYMYVVSDHEVVALDENDWTRTGRVEIGDRVPQPYPRRPVEPMPQPTPTPDVERESGASGDGVSAPTVGQDGEATSLTGREDVTVEVGAGAQGFRFEPADIVVDEGTTVRWVWNGRGGQHNVVESDGEQPLGKPSFGSELADGENEFTHTFGEPGSYDYVCAPHIAQGMVGTVEVVENGGNSSA
ncbi:beta-propeller domain-containing protein [Haladaptatus sp. F3-133]|uniref:Beta-propeller domain-containing protein n=1 Tax=Halorutilus salinus TaxID=2487751 RepID=A0A9Q4C4J4_9EURY|nr:beta-propeller domain-containing protein [Halorutilus salinus]MCX2819011.1 beta-propeller domain-containing protein [Halorutilus salinus]